MTSAEQMIRIQSQVKQNQHELSQYVTDLDAWSKEIKHKEQLLKQSQSPENENQMGVPPIRNSLHKKKAKKTVKEKKSETHVKAISGYDFSAWDKYDVDAALAEIDQAGDKNSSSSEYETDEEWEIEKRKQQALLEKEKGNSQFKAGKYESATESYTLAIECDSTNPVLFANRAQALLKQEKYAAAESDCTSCLSLDPFYVKAYLRRGQARLALRKLLEALQDFETLLKLEPSQKIAERHISDIKSLLSMSSATVDPAAHVHAIHKPPETRSKKPLFEVQIEEIGVYDTGTNEILHRELKSRNKEKLIAKDEKRFNNLIRDHNGKREMNENTSFSSELLDENLKARQSKISLIEEVQNKIECASHAGEVSPKNQSKNSLINTNVSPPVLLKNNENRTNMHTKNLGDCNTTNVIQKAESRSPSLHCFLPKPTSSFQFHSDWKDLSKTEARLFQYIKQLPSSDYPRLIGQFFDVDILMSFIRVFANCYIREKLNVYPSLDSLSQVKRFSMIIMFLEKGHRREIKELFISVASTQYYDEEIHRKLMKLYDMQ